MYRNQDENRSNLKELRVNYRGAARWCVPEHLRRPSLAETTGTRGEATAMAAYMAANTSPTITVDVVCRAGGKWSIQEKRKRKKSER